MIPGFAGVAVSLDGSVGAVDALHSASFSTSLLDVLGWGLV